MVTVSDRALGAVGGRSWPAPPANLGMHLRVLVEAGYVEPSHSWRGRRRTTLYTPTAAGRAALERHVAALQAVISATKPD